MQFPEITPFSPSSKTKETNWAKQVVSWLGRFCSFCSSSLMFLINKVKLSTSLFFTQQTSPSPSIAIPSQPPLSASKSFKSEEDETVIENTCEADEANLSLSQLFEDQEAIDINTDGEQFKKEELKQREEDLLQVKKESPSKFTKFKRLRKRQQTTIESIETLSLQIRESFPVTENLNEETSTPTQDSPPVSAKPTQPKLDPIYYDNKGGGNCQMLAILKGLEMQYPDRLKDLRKSQDDDLTAQQLRQMGVDFARTQIDSCGKYAELVLSYVDTDRKEFNRVYIDPVMKKKNEDLQTIETDYKTRKITKKVYEKRIKDYKTTHATTIAKLKNDTLIYSDELFLNALEKNGFYCSTLHLFALSILLQIPIYVKEQFGVKDHDIQMFNPTQSESEPIHLYRVANQHYQYIFYAKD